MDYIKIFCFDIVPGYIFKGYKIGNKNIKSISNNTRVAIMVAKKQDKKEYHITDLLRWNDKKREEMFLNLENKIYKGDFNKDIFPKIWDKKVYDFYQKIKNVPKIKDILSKGETEYCLYIPSTPRYFISASKKELNRTSIKKIYFKNEEDYNRCYVLLNSSIMYWWRRAMDGWMSLPLQTLLSLPFLNIDTTTKDFENIIKIIEESEKNNLIKTLNWQKVNENIKHPKEIIRKINSFLIKDNELIQKLEKYHKNNSF